MIRALCARDFEAAAEVYPHLASVPTPEAVADHAAFEAVLAHPGTQVLGAFVDGRLVSVLTLHVLPNMTHHGRPYALIENVVTLPEYRGQGYARALFERATEVVRAAGGYKIMLLTGRKNDAKAFYEKVGFDPDEKWGMVMRLPTGPGT